MKTSRAVAGLARAVLVTAGVAAIIVGARRRYFSYAGPYNIVVKELRSCTAEESGPTADDFEMYGLMHYNRTLKHLVYDGNFTIKRDISTGSLKLTVFAARWDTVSGWRENFLVMPVGDVCRAVENFVSDLFKHLAAHIRDMPSKCPFQAGLRIVENVPAKMGQLQNVPALPYGHYKLLSFLPTNPQTDLVKAIFDAITKKPNGKTTDLPRFCIHLVVDVISASEP